MSKDTVGLTADEIERKIIEGIKKFQMIPFSRELLPDGTRIITIEYTSNLDAERRGSNHFIEWLERINNPTILVQARKRG